MITGKQARELLDGTTPGPWEARPNGVVVSYSTQSQIQLVGHNQRALGDAPLMAAAPDLAETVAWLHGREADDEAVWDDHYEVSVMADKRVAVFDHDATTTYFTPDEAIEFARALLAAAEQARDE